MSKASDPSEAEKKYIEERINRLERFAQMASEVASHLREEVRQTKG